MQRKIAILFLLLCGLALSSSAQQRPDPNSPRYKGLVALRDFLGSEGQEALKSFLDEKIAPSLLEAHGKDELLRLLSALRAQFSGRQSRGGQPMGPFSASIFYSGEGRASVEFEVTPEEPHRFIFIDFGQADDKQPPGS